MLTVQEAALILKVSAPTVRSYARRGLLEPDIVKQLGKSGRYSRMLFRRGTLDDFIRRYSTNEYLGEELLSTGDIVEYTGIPMRTLHGMIKRGVVKPDIVLPDTDYGKSGRNRFKKSTADKIIASGVWKPRRSKKCQKEIET